MRGLLVLLIGCNQVYGLDQTRLPLDAGPPKCPDLGTGPPIFAESIFQAVRTTCSRYTISASANRAVAACKTGTPFAEGPIDRPLMPAMVDIPQLASPGFVVLAPEGDQVLISLDATRIDVYQRNANNVWSSVGQLPAGGITSTPTRGPSRHVLLANTTAQTLVEYIGANNTWTRSNVMHDYKMLGAGAEVMMSLSPDGRRLVFAGANNVMMYTDRPDVDSPFLTPAMIPDAPTVRDPFMTEDCARIYFSSQDLRSIFYIELAPLI